MTENAERALCAARRVLDALAKASNSQEANHRLAECQGYFRALSEMELITTGDHSALDAEAQSTRKNWHSKSARDLYLSFDRDMESMIAQLSKATSIDEMNAAILGTSMMIGSAAEESIISEREEEVLREKLEVAASVPGQRLGVANPVQSLQFDEAPPMIVTVREMIEHLQELPEKSKDLPLACEDENSYFDCRTPEVEVRDRKTHSWTEVEDPESVVLI